MDIDVTMKIDSEAMMSKSEKSRTVATGWVEVMNCIKFPVFVRTYRDKETQEEKAFVSMPQRKGTKGYTNIISFEDKKIREEVEEAVLRNVQKQAVKAFDVIPIKDTKITLLPEDSRNRQVKIRGIASVRLEEGIRIQGILIKEGKNGLFVEMPQYFAEGKYHDTVYGTTDAMRKQLSEQILEAYNRQVEQQLHPELIKEETEVKPEESERIEEPSTSLSWIDRFAYAFADRNKEEVLKLFEELRGVPDIISSEKTDDILTMEQAEYKINEKTSILLIFDNTYEKDREIKDGIDIRQEITVVLKESDKKPEMLAVLKTSSGNLKDAQEQYERAIQSWTTLTHQTSALETKPIISIQQPIEEHKEDVTESGTNAETDVLDVGDKKSEKEEQPAKENPKTEIEKVPDEKMMNAAAVKEFMNAYLENDRTKMLAAVSHAKVSLGEKSFSHNYNSLAFQEVSFGDGINTISVRFRNGYAPEQTVPSADSKRQLIEAVIYENGNAKAIRTLAEKKTISLNKAAANYEEVKAYWMQLTHQNEITFKAPAEKQKSPTI